MDRVTSESSVYPKLRAEWNDPKKLEVFSLVVEGVNIQLSRGRLLRNDKAWTVLSLPMKSYAEEKLDSLVKEGVLCRVKSRGEFRYTLSDDYYPTYVGHGGSSGHGDCDESCPFLASRMPLDIEDMAVELLEIEKRRRHALPFLSLSGCTVVTETEGGFSIRKRGKDSSDEESVIFPFPTERTRVSPENEDSSVTLLRQSGITIDDDDEEPSHGNDGGIRPSSPDYKTPLSGDFII